MPREHEAYRDNLASLLEAFPNKRLLTVSDVTRYLGCSRPTVEKRFNIGRGGITVETLARKLCRL